PNFVSEQGDGFVGDRDAEFMFRGVDDGAADDEGGIDGFGQGGGCFAQLQLAAGNAGNVEQVVDESDQFFQLVGDNAGQFGDLGGFVRSPGQEFGGRGQRGQRVAQFMGQDGQKGVFAA